MSQSSPPPAPFGTALGIAPGGVPVYSSDYASADDTELPDRHSYRSYVDGIYMGHKWQCVEFARRWLYVNRGYIFDDVAMAYDIFELRSARVVGADTRLPLHAFANGSKRHPEPGCLIIWDEGGEFADTGHVAIVTEVHADRLRLVEQNVGHQIWPPGRDHSREIPATISPEGDYWLECSFGDASILGWVIQTDNAEHAEPVETPDPRLHELALREVPDRGQIRRSWLNVANADEAAYVEMMGGHKLTDDESFQRRYVCISATVEEALDDATNTLHGLFMHATDYVLRDTPLLARFGIPEVLWPKIRQSWNNRRNHMITGRFDFALTAAGLKLYEYNCDSASGHMECGKVQDKWARHFGCNSGRDTGRELHARLRDAWRARQIDGVVHILHDHDLEELYHALFMQEAMDEAGVRSKLIRGMSGLAWNAAGDICDADGEPIRWVWKTWAWETALDQMRAECEDDADRLRRYRAGGDAGAPREGSPRLVDVLLRDEVMVFEPLWTLIPSNKAILPVLWQLFPNHPNLLASHFDLTADLQAKGYVAKPIVGRCGDNISIVDADASVLAETGGRFAHRDQIFQELCPLPVLDGYNMQLNAFSVSGVYAGACVRIDPSLIVNKDSDIIALRAIDDEHMLALG